VKSVRSGRDSSVFHEWRPVVILSECGLDAEDSENSSMTEESKSEGRDLGLDDFRSLAVSDDQDRKHHDPLEMGSEGIGMGKKDMWQDVGNALIPKIPEAQAISPRVESRNEKAALLRPKKTPTQSPVSSKSLIKRRLGSPARSKSKKQPRTHAMVFEGNEIIGSQRKQRSPTQLDRNKDSKHRQTLHDMQQASPPRTRKISRRSQNGTYNSVTFGSGTGNTGSSSANQPGEDLNRASSSEDLCRIELNSSLNAQTKDSWDWYHVVVSPPPLRGSPSLLVTISIVLLVLMVYFWLYIQVALCKLNPLGGFVPLLVFPFAPYVAIYCTLHGLAMNAVRILRNSVTLHVYSLLNLTLAFGVAGSRGCNGCNVSINAGIPLLVMTMLCISVLRNLTSQLDYHNDLELAAASERIKFHVAVTREGKVRRDSLV